MVTKERHDKRLRLEVSFSTIFEVISPRVFEVLVRTRK
jgi:hypothetical protein